MPKTNLFTLFTNKPSSLKASELLERGKYGVYGAQGILGYLDTYQTSIDSLAVIKDGAGIGRVQVIPKNSSVIGTIQLLIPNDNTDLLYAYYLLKYLDLGNSYSGATIPHIYFKNYGKREIEFKKLAEQECIGKELSSIDLLISKAKTDIQMLEALIKSRFIEMFGACQTWKNLEDVPSKITDGSHNPPKGIAYSKYIMLSSQNVFDELDLSDVRYLSEADYLFENKRTHIEEDDVLLTIVGTIGRTHVVKNSEKFVFQRSVGVIKPNHQYIKGRYLSEYLKSTDATNQIEVSGHGVAQKGIYLGNLKKLLIKVPSMEMQNSFVEFMELIDKLKFNIPKTLFSLFSLFFS